MDITATSQRFNSFKSPMNFRDRGLNILWNRTIGGSRALSEKVTKWQCGAVPLRHFFHNRYGPLAGPDGRVKPESMENYSICPSGSEIKKVDPCTSTDS